MWLLHRHLRSEKIKNINQKKGLINNQQIRESAHSSKSGQNCYGMEPHEKGARGFTTSPAKPAKRVLQNSFCNRKSLTSVSRVSNSICTRGKKGGGEEEVMV